MDLNVQVPAWEGLPSLPLNPASSRGAAAGMLAPRLPFTSSPSPSGNPQPAQDRVDLGTSSVEHFQRELFQECADSVLKMAWKETGLASEQNR